MDDNLSIHLEDYLGNPIIVEKCKFTKEEVTAALKKSDKFIYDEENDMIKLKFKPRRRIIVFRDIPKEKQTCEEIKNLFKTSGEKAYENKIVRIEDFIEDVFMVYFDEEEITTEIFKWIEEIKEKVKKFN